MLSEYATCVQEHVDRNYCTGTHKHNHTWKGIRACLREAGIWLLIRSSTSAAGACTESSPLHESNMIAGVVVKVRFQPGITQTAANIICSAFDIP